MLRYRLSYIAVLGAAFLFYIFFTGYLSAFTLVAICLMTVVSLIFLLLAAGKTSVTVDASHLYANKEEEFIFHVKLQNRSIFPVSMARLSFNFENSLDGEIQKEVFFFSISSRSEVTVQYPMQSRYCGKITAKLTRIKYYDALGIFSVKKKAGQEAFVFVTPNNQTFSLIADTPKGLGTDSSDYLKTKAGDDTSEIFDIRPYQSTDQLRSVHWKLSMKLDTLMAKEFSLLQDSSLLLLVELMATNMAALDTVVETLVSLSNMLLDGQKNHRVEWYDRAVNQFNELDVKNNEDLAVLVSSVLSARRYKDMPHSINYRNSLSGSLHDCPVAVYITGSLSGAVTEFCCRPGAIKTTVLYCGQIEESQRELTDSLLAMDVKIVEVIPERTGESLSGLEV